MFDRKYLDRVKGDLNLLKNEAPKIIDELSTAFNKGYELTTNEKDFFCSILHYSKGQDTEELITHFNFCDDFIFEQLYFTYSYPNDNLDCLLNQRDAFSCVIPLDQRNKDGELLAKWAIEWETSANNEAAMMDTNIDDFLKAQLKETRRALKALCKKPEFNSLEDSIRDNKFQYQKKKLLLWNKWLYIKSRQFIEDVSLTERQFSHNGDNIRIDEYSYAHILNGHYGQTAKPVYQEKTVFDEEFKAEEIYMSLVNIFKILNNSRFTMKFDKDKIYFEIKEKPYAIYFEEGQKNYKGKPSERFIRVKTFYPLGKGDELNSLYDSYEKFTLNEQIKVFSKVTRI